MKLHNTYTRKILSEIDGHQRVTQRHLANELGIALGLTNLLVRKLVKRGWISVVNIKPNRVQYLLTPAGMAAKARVTRKYLQRTTQLYTETRERIRERLDVLSAELSNGAGGNGSSDGQKTIVFYGAGEVAEIGYVSLQGTDLHLVGVVDDVDKHEFFGMPVYSPSLLTPDGLDGKPFGRVVVMSFQKGEQIQARLEATGFPRDHVFLL